MRSNVLESTASLERVLVEKYGPLLTRSQLAEVLQRQVGGLNWELSRQDGLLRSLLEPATLKLGRRCFYRAPDLAVILASEGLE